MSADCDLIIQPIDLISGLGNRKISLGRLGLISKSVGFFPEKRNWSNFFLSN